MVEYKITHDADGFGTPNTMTREDLLDLIRDAGFRPVERDTRYGIIREYDGPAPHRSSSHGWRSREPGPGRSSPGIGSITALAFVVVLVPAIVIAAVLHAFGASLAVSCMLGLLIAFIGMGFYPRVLKRLGWLPGLPAGDGSREESARARAAVRRADLRRLPGLAASAVRHRPRDLHPGRR